VRTSLTANKELHNDILPLESPSTPPQRQAAATVSFSNTTPNGNELQEAAAVLLQEHYVSNNGNINTKLHNISM
jgi:hypothetical protein